MYFLCFYVQEMKRSWLLQMDYQSSISVSMDPHLELLIHRTPSLQFTWQLTMITGITLQAP